MQGIVDPQVWRKFDSKAESMERVTVSFPQCDLNASAEGDTASAPKKRITEIGEEILGNMCRAS